MRPSFKISLAAAVLLLGTGLSVLAAPAHRRPRPPYSLYLSGNGGHPAPNDPGALGSTTAFYSTTTPAAAWSSGLNTGDLVGSGAGQGLFFDGVFAPFSVGAVTGLSSVATAELQPVLSGQGIINFAPLTNSLTAGEQVLQSDVSTGTKAGDVFIPIGNLDVVIDKLGNPHYITLAILANDLESDVNENQTHGALAHFIPTPGQALGTSFSLCNVIAAHSSSEPAPGFEDKPWMAYNSQTDTILVSWTHFTPPVDANGDGVFSTIMVSTLPNASQSTPDSPGTWTAPVRLDQSGFTQGSNIEVNNSVSGGVVYVQWQDTDAAGNATVATAKSTDNGASFPTSNFATVDPVNLAYGILDNGVNQAQDGRIRIGPFPGYNPAPPGFPNNPDATQSGLRQNSFPVMTIDQSGDAGAGQLVTVWQQANPSNPGNVLEAEGSFNNEAFTITSDADIFIVRTDPTALTIVGPGPTGASSLPGIPAGVVRVNQNNPLDFTDQFEPAVTVSKADGSVHVVFLDRSGDPGSLASGGLLQGNIKVGASLQISTNGGATWLPSNLALTAGALGGVSLPGNPAPIQEQGFDPVFGDYIGIQSIPNPGGAGTEVVAAFGAVDTSPGSNPAQPPNGVNLGLQSVDPVSATYVFTTGAVTPSVVNMLRDASGQRTHVGNCSEMSLAMTASGGVFASSNDFQDVNPTLLADFEAVVEAPLPGASTVPPADNPGADLTSGGGGGGGGCFIATAAYGSYLDPHVMSLRHFRDHVLEPSAPGRALVAWYYRWSPPAAHVISSRPLLRWMARMALTPVVFCVEQPLLVGALLLGLLTLQIRRLRRGRLAVLAP